jgi:hypothetical protein
MAVLFTTLLTGGWPDIQAQDRADTHYTVIQAQFRRRGRGSFSTVGSLYGKYEQLLTLARRSGFAVRASAMYCFR